MKFHVHKCIHCGHAHDVEAVRDVAKNGRALARWTCPTTHKRSVTFLPGSSAKPEPGKVADHKPHKPAKPAKAPKAEDHKPAKHTGGHVADKQHRTISLDATARYDLDPASGVDVILGFVERLAEHGTGSASVLVASADAMMRTHAARSKGSAKDAVEHQTGRDLADVFVRVVAAYRIDPITFLVAFYPKELAEAYAAAANGGDPLAPHGVYDAAKRGVLPEGWASRAPDLSQALGAGEGQAPVLSRAAAGLGLGTLGMRAGGVLGPWGSILGGVGGAVLGVMYPEASETLDQMLGTDKSPADDRGTDVMADERTRDAAASTPLEGIFGKGASGGGGAGSSWGGKSDKLGIQLRLPGAIVD